MHNYDFYNIFAFAPFEFQQFACAMISIREGKEFQRFGVGKDGGIDGQYETEDGIIILQVKNTRATGKALLTIARKEKKKIEECHCKRYIMVFSTPTISPGLKEEIKKLFPDILSTNDILSAADLNAMLDEEKYEHLDKEYPQLWFGNGMFLEKMLSQNVISEIEKAGKVNEKRKEMEETEKKICSYAEIYTGSKTSGRKWWAYYLRRSGSGKNNPCVLHSIILSESKGL